MQAYKLFLCITLFATPCHAMKIQYSNLSLLIIRADHKNERTVRRATMKMFPAYLARLSQEAESFVSMLTRQDGPALETPLQLAVRLNIFSVVKNLLPYYQALNIPLTTTNAYGQTVFDIAQERCQTLEGIRASTAEEINELFDRHVNARFICMLLHEQLRSQSPETKTA